MRVLTCDHFVLPLPEGHRFPMTKYRLLRERIEDDTRFTTQVPAPADDATLALAHDGAYIERVRSGQLDAREQRTLGFPWSEALVERSRRSVGATIEACRIALSEGAAVNLAGGTHHAYRDQAQGFCVFNDAAVAARQMQHEGRVHQVTIIDCDVHQGNGTAHILQNDPSVFTFSIHGGANFPFRKEHSDLDVALADGTDDTGYLTALQQHLPQVLARQPQLVIYLAGADPYEGDRLGRLALSKAGLRKRDRYVFEHCAALGIPVAMAMAGGYAPQVEDIVDIHEASVHEAWRHAQHWL